MTDKTKICTQCKIEQLETEFHLKNNVPRTVCKTCTKLNNLERKARVTSEKLKKKAWAEKQADEILLQKELDSRENPTEKSEKTKPKRADQVAVMHIRNEIKQQLIDCKSTEEIIAYLSTKFDRADATFRCYIFEIRKELSERMTVKLEDARAQAAAQMLKQYHKMVFKYEQKEDPRVMALAVQFWDRYCKMFPNGLAPEIETPDAAINISFSKIQPLSIEASAEVVSADAVDEAVIVGADDE